ncbi:hypothetical protein F5883DRAFT_649482 [Diaporthe sp. PMI_573]|nr:hypothetical protein F5883DRAFT_649482 [Diaporthaceae sp. PMI_573]
MSPSADILTTMGLAALIIMSIAAVGSCLGVWAQYLETRRENRQRRWWGWGRQGAGQWGWARRGVGRCAAALRWGWGWAGARVPLARLPREVVELMELEAGRLRRAAA